MEMPNNWTSFDWDKWLVQKPMDNAQERWNMIRKIRVAENFGELTTEEADRLVDNLYGRKTWN